MFLLFITKDLDAYASSGVDMCESQGCSWQMGIGPIRPNLGSAHWTKGKQWKPV